MALASNSPLVTTEWLAAHMSAPDLRVVDATWFMPALGRNARKEFEDIHIPGAVHFDINDIADSSSDLPHMVPGTVKFAARVRKLGLGDGSRIVVYDNNGFSASARAWWMFRLYGHDDVAVLDGGLGLWVKEGRETGDLPSTPSERHFTARQNNLLLRDLEQIRGNLTSRREQIVDARSAGRFSASEPEPREGLRGGHIPASLNLPVTEVIGADGRMKPRDELAALLAPAGIDSGRPITTSCGSGVTAATLALAFAVLGRFDVAVYDGSWTEWGGRQDTPVEA
ncbi:MAG: 3-mercaptopyruvate sulfurtransferase [Geminicoccaceae bacterium]|nr:3-mercaptopyruvate sulfurtransferase [Geminicoccaceae bacterium]